MSTFVSMQWYRDWKGVIDGHYGSLAQFSDAPTVRTHLVLVREWLADDLRITAQLDAEGKKDWLEVFGEDIRIAHAAEAELLAWLDARKLERPSNPFAPRPDGAATAPRP